MNSIDDYSKVVHYDSIYDKTQGTAYRFQHKYVITTKTWDQNEQIDEYVDLADVQHQEDDEYYFEYY